MSLRIVSKGMFPGSGLDTGSDAAVSNRVGCGVMWFLKWDSLTPRGPASIQVELCSGLRGLQY